MMFSYRTPSSEVLDLSKFQFAKNQATCGADLLGGVTLEESPGNGYCGYGEYNDVSNQLFICLSGSVDENLLEGLTANTTDGNSFVTSNCSPSSDFFDECDGVAYQCVVNGNYANTNSCLISLECPDGTVLNFACPDNSACVIATNSIQG
jgi:hypothetical protein